MGVSASSQFESAIIQGHLETAIQIYEKSPQVFDLGIILHLALSCDCRAMSCLVLWFCCHVFPVLTCLVFVSCLVVS